MDKVSVIMPAYNSSKFIAKSIQCVLDQSYVFLELIIICDAPTDDTVEITKRFTDYRVKIVEFEENRGVSEARNAGLKLAVGRYIAFCDADDYWYKEKLSIQIELLKASNFSVCHASCDLVDISGSAIGSRCYPNLVTYKMMRHRNFICNSSGLYDTSKLPIILQKQIYHEDYLMWLELLSYAEISVGSNEPLLMYTVNPNGLSSNKLRSLLGAVKIQRQHGLGWLECGANFFLNVKGRLIEFFLPSSRS
jgi:glycosyltransferase involved in cell wall biosynthesis